MHCSERNSSTLIKFKTSKQRHKLFLAGLIYLKNCLFLNELIAYCTRKQRGASEHLHFDT